MKLLYQFEIVDMGSEVIAVPVGKDAEKLHGIIKLNKEGLEIFQMLNADTTVDKIVATLRDKYQNKKDELEKYVIQTIQKMEVDGLVG